MSRLEALRAQIEELEVLKPPQCWHKANVMVAPCLLHPLRSSRRTSAAGAMPCRRRWNGPLAFAERVAWGTLQCVQTCCSLGMLKE